MPTFVMNDVFCVVDPDGPQNGDFIDFSGGTVLDGISFDANAGTNGGPVVSPDGSTGNVFNGEVIKDVGEIKTTHVDCDGNNHNSFTYYFITDAGKTYYVAQDPLGDGDFEGFHADSVGPRKEQEFRGITENNDQEICPVVPCFTPDMPIETSRGSVRAGDLKAGDQVRTYDNGLQTVRFVHRTTVPAVGQNTPVLFVKHAINNSAPLIVSQMHRMYTGTLPDDQKAQLPDGTDNLLHAVSFCNGTTVRLMHEVKTVTYVHIMLDNHELLFCNGTVSESWQPTAKALEQAPEVAEELLSLFPEIDQRKSYMPGALARTELKLRPDASH